MTTLRLLLTAALLGAGMPLMAVPAMTRGPYLQMANPTAISLCWRTDAAGTGRIRYGTAAGALTAQSDEPGAVTEHTVRLTGLTPATTYYYSVETDGTVLAGGGSYFFRTPPADGAAESVRFWALGDCGTAGSVVRSVRDAFVPLHAQRRADLVLLLGDNAYYTGTDADYQAAIFDVFPALLRETPFWSCIGNQ
jgi:acid phosphatase type 7